MRNAKREPRGKNNAVQYCLHRPDRTIAMRNK